MPTSDAQDPTPRAERSESETLIRKLYEITANYRLGFDEQVRQLLQLGCERFHLDIGILARVQGNRYTVVQSVAPDTVEIPPGVEFELGDTYCQITLSADGPVGLEHVGTGAHAAHPAYQKFQLESYFGAPVRVLGDTYGTLNFSSPHPRTEPFTELDVDCLMIMERWISAALYRDRIESDLRRALRRVEFQVKTDSLTGLVNRKGLADRLDRHLMRAQREGLPVAAILINLARFHQVNDRFGATAGDAYLQATANALEAGIRPTDVVGRVGGDRFMIVLPSCDLSATAAICDRLRTDLAVLDVAVDGRPVQCSAELTSAAVESCANFGDVLRTLEHKLRDAKGGRPGASGTR